MASDIFVDTSGFYAVLAQRDECHARAVEILRLAQNECRRFVTTDYVLDETATLLKARGEASLMKRFFETVRATRVCRVEWTDATKFEATERFFLRHLDHAWSFTDCLSFQTMKDLRLREAMTKDKHFREAGYVPLLADRD